MIAGWFAGSGGVLDQLVHDVDPDSRDSTHEPEAKDLVEGVAHLAADPVQIRLFGQEAMMVVLACSLVVRPGAAAEHALLVVRLVAPDVPLPLLGVAGGAGVEEPLMSIARVCGNEIEEDPNAPPPASPISAFRSARLPRSGCTSQ